MNVEAHFQKKFNQIAYLALIINLICFNCQAKEISDRTLRLKDTESEILTSLKLFLASSDFVVTDKSEEITSELRRIKRAENYEDPNAPSDVDFDMEVAEINVFRPLFGYRIEYAKQVKNHQRQFG